MMEDNLAALEGVIHRLLAERFSDTVITRVRARSDVDSDGDRILRVDVVLDTSKPLDKKELVGFVRRLRSRLTDAHADEFPIVSFMSKSEAGKLELETA